MATATSIFKYRDFNKSSLELLINRQIWFAKPDTLNDPFECQMIFKDILKAIWLTHDIADDFKNKIEQQTEEILLTSGICSFSKVRQNQLMWSHYADEHKGFCIGFEKEKLKSELPEIKEITVNYQDDYPYNDIMEIINDCIENLDGDFSNVIIQSIVRKIIQTKYTNWRYEREVRLTSYEYGAFAFSPKAVNSIAFGLKTSDRDKKTLRKLVSGPDWCHVKWYQAHKSVQKFGLDFLRI